MRKLICDICGKDAVDPARTELHSELTDSQGNKLTLRLRVISHDGSDLCARCIRAFFKGTWAVVSSTSGLVMEKVEP